MFTRESLQFCWSLILIGSGQFQGTDADVLANRGVRSSRLEFCVSVYLLWQMVVC